MGKVVTDMFSTLGFTIGSHPFTFISISLAIFTFSLLGPVLNLDIRMDLESGFTRKDAPSAEEISAHVNFFGDKGNPWYMALFAVARNGSLLSESQSDELTTFYKYITQQMELKYDNETFKYRDDLCEPFCHFNAQLWSILQYQSFIKLTYPQSTVGPYKINIGKFFFDRKTTRSGVVTSVGTVAMYFTTFVDSMKKEMQLKLFEQGVLSELKRHNSNKNNSITFVLHGANTVSKEVQRGVYLSAPYYFIGAALLTVFVFASFVFGSMSFAQFDVSKLLMAFMAIISPLLAAFTAIGFILIVGSHINMLVIISPFLTLAIGIGVDDAFLMTNTWMQQRDTAIQQNRSPAERLQMVFEKVGAAIAVTSLTNVIGFLLGSIAPVPEIRLFCLAVALSMFMDLIFQLALYAPLHVLFSSWQKNDGKYKQVKAIYNNQEKKAEQSSFSAQLRQSFTLFIKYYSKFVASLWAEFIMVGFLIVYLYISIRGISSLRSDMDGKMLLPKDSQSNEGIRIMSEVVWPDFLGINYIIRNPPNFSDPVEYRKFDEMVNDIQSMDSAIGSHANLIWIKDYLRFLANPSASKLDVFFGWFGREGNETEAKRKGLDMSEFEMFINTEPYTAWQDGLRYVVDRRNRTIITSMLFIVAYNGVSSLPDKARLLTACRAAAARYPEYDMIPFDTDAQLIDVILSVPTTTYHTMTFTVIAMGVVFFGFSTNFMTTIVATLSVASICTGVLGILHYWDCYLDPLTMVAVIMTAGLGVDFTVHIIFHYLNNQQNKMNCSKRIAAAFNGCALSTVQAGLSTFLVMFPVLFAPVGVYVVIAKAIVLVVAIGLIHGLFLVPVLLATIPSSFTGKACCGERQHSLK